MYKPFNQNRILKEVEKNEPVLEVQVQGDDCNWIVLKVGRSFYEIARLYGDELVEVLNGKLPYSYMYGAYIEEWKEKIQFIIELIKKGLLKKIRFVSVDPRTKFVYEVEINKVKVRHSFPETTYILDYGDEQVEIIVDKRELRVTARREEKVEVLRVIDNDNEYLITFKYKNGKLVFKKCVVSKNIEGFYLPVEEIEEFEKLPESVRGKVLEKLNRK